MYKDLLTHSPLLMLPIIAMFLFLAVFIGVVIHTFTEKQKTYGEAAAVPLKEDS